MPSTKAVVINNLKWTGFITYTGIGRVGKKHTSEFIKEWIRDLDNATFAEAVERIRYSASLWVRKVKPGAKQTFVVATYLDDQPTAAIVSNFQKWHGADVEKVESAFFVTNIVGKAQPEVIVTGLRESVPRPKRRALAKLVGQGNQDRARIRRAMADANRDSASRFPGLISEDCFVYSQDSDGHGQYETMGDSRTDNPISFNNQDAEKQVRNLLNKQFGKNKWSLRSMASVRGAGNKEPPSPCTPEFAKDISKSDWQVIELTLPEGRRATPRSMNGNGVIVGEGCPKWGGPNYPCIWTQTGDIQFLPNAGGPGGAARDINESGMIVGNASIPDGPSHACTWELGGAGIDIGEQIARHSQACTVSDKGDVAGWISIHETEGGQAHFRPAYWPKSGSPVVLDDLGGGWGEAVDINSTGNMLLRIHPGSNFLSSQEAVAWLWDGTEVVKIGKPGSDFRYFSPHRLTDEMEIVGLTIRQDQQRCAAIVDTKGDWSFLFDPLNGREFTAANRKLQFAGYDLIDQYRVPWLENTFGEITNYLPYFKYHHHRISMVSDEGWAIGTAASDNCCHPILWKPAKKS